MKKTLYGILLVLLLCTVTACGTAEVEKTQENGETKEKEPLIGISFDSFLIERWQTDRDVFVDAAEERGARVNVQNANGDVETQIAQIRYLISKPVDVLVIIGIDADSLSDVCEEAKAAGIPVIAYDRMLRNTYTDLYVSFDTKKVGKLMGEALAKQSLPHKKVLMLNGPTEDNNVIWLAEGFKEVMKEHKITIVDEANMPNWKAEAASDYIYEHKEILGDIDGIMCGNDNLATAVSRALSELRMAGKIKLVGQDADLEACQRIMQGTQVMTVYKPVEYMAKTAAEYACRLAKGESLADVTDTVSNGQEQIPCVMLDPVAVDQNNMDETIISAGFHLEEDVYLYVPGHGEKRSN